LPPPSPASKSLTTGRPRWTVDGQPDASNRLAGSLNNLAVRLGDLGRREDALTAIEEAVTIRRELAAKWPDAHHHELEQSLRVAAWLEQGEDLNDASPREPK